MRGCLHAGVLGAVLAVSACATAPEPATPAWKAQVDVLIAPWDRPGMPGLAVGVVQDGKLVYARGAGLADIATGERIDARSNFRLASVSKQLTAAGILALVEDGRLSLDERLYDLFPGFPDWARAITVRHLLVHRSGLSDYEDLMPDAFEGQLRDEQALALMQAQSQPLFPAGERFRYSNSGYVLLGLLIQQRSGMRYSDWLRSRLFQRLGMDGTRGDALAGSPAVPHRALGHTETDGLARRTDQSSTSAMLGDGGIYSSVRDLARWIAAIEDGSALSPVSLQAMFTAVPDPETPGVGYGYGWFIDHLNGQRRHWHTGSSRGFRHKLLHFPDRRLAVVVLSNMTRPDEPALALADSIAGIVDPALRLDAASAPPKPEVR